MTTGARSLLEGLAQRVIRRAKEEVSAGLVRGVESGLLPSHRDYVRFVVVSGIRTGSTMLTDVLDQHPNARTFFELFHIDPGAVPFNVEGYRARARDPSVMRLRDEDPVGFLEQHIWGAMPTHVRAVGFKLLHTQARATHMWWDEPDFADWWSHVDNTARKRWHGARSDLWKSLAADKRVRIILLRRENLMHGAVSAAIAKQSGLWGDGASGGYGGSRDMTITLPTEHLIRDFDAASRHLEGSREWFKDHPTLSLSYEDLADAPAQAGMEVQRFLGLPPRRIEARTRKQATRPYAEVVGNWAEVVSALRGTPWERFLVDGKPNS